MKNSIKHLRYYRESNRYCFKYTNNIFKDYKNATEDIKVYCPYCSHTNNIPVQREFWECSYCKNKIKNNTKGRFKWKIRQLMNSKSGLNE